MKLVSSVMASLTILALSSTFGCFGAEQACTDIGCLDGVSIRLTSLASKSVAFAP